MSNQQPDQGSGGRGSLPRFGKIMKRWPLISLAISLAALAIAIHLMNF
jgi:hypothetical protein